MTDDQYLELCRDFLDLAWAHGLFRNELFTIAAALTGCRPHLTLTLDRYIETLNWEHTGQLEDLPF